MSVFTDYILFLKIFVFLLFLRWLTAKVPNKILFTVGLFIGGYYIFFARWSMIGVLIVAFVLLIMSGLGNFMQDVIFQYSSLPDMEERMMEQSRAEQAREMAYYYGVTGLLRRR